VLLAHLYKPEVSILNWSGQNYIRYRLPVASVLVQPITKMDESIRTVSDVGRKRYGAVSAEEGDGNTETVSANQPVLCTVFETTCNLVSVLTGSGMLSLPYAAAKAGWFALVLLVVLSSIFMYSFDLLACSMETYYTRVNQRLHQSMKDYHIDYLTFGTLAFGQNGGTIVLLIFILEVSLALVSFLMNIGINIHVINSDIPVSTGIVLSACLTCIMAFTNLKAMSFSSAVGLALTLLTVLAIFVTGLQLSAEDAELRQDKSLDVGGVPMALGLVAFCYGGHVTL
jgi:amino acid permease